MTLQIPVILFVWMKMSHQMLVEEIWDDVVEKLNNSGVYVELLDYAYDDDSKHKPKHGSGASDVKLQFVTQDQPSQAISHLTQDQPSQDLKQDKPTDMVAALLLVIFWLQIW